MCESTSKAAEDISRLKKERDEYRKLYELLREENERLKRGLLGQKAERTPNDAKQLSLALLEELLSEREEEAPKEQEVKPYKRKKPTGRKPIPDDLPTVTIELLPDEVKEKGLDAFERIGEEVTKTLERRPQSIICVETIRPKFVPKDRPKDGPTTVHIAEVPELPIERGLAGPSFLADTIVKRWDDHLPLNRQERIHARDGIHIARSTMCGWHMSLAQLCQSLIQAMLEDAYTLPYLCTDATGVLVQSKDKCKKGHFWVLVAPERHVLFRYSSQHNSDAVDALLKGYQGYLVADAHSVYDHLYGKKLKEVACWAHCRRYFFKALGSDPERAKYALALIAQLFKIERSIAGKSRKKKESVRKKKSQKIVDRFFAWCQEQRDEVLDETPISKAIGYALNQEQALRRFLKDGRLPIHNNVSEFELRREAVGRKNWIFLGSKDGALANTTFVSLIASCHMHGIEPWSYLRDLLCLLPSWPNKRVLELAPAYWHETLKQEETQARLSANIFREVVLKPPNEFG